MPQTEKQLTAMQALKNEVESRMNASVFANEFNAYKNIYNYIDTELLATERQQLESAVKYGQDNKTVFAPCNYMEITFKTQ